MNPLDSYQNYVDSVTMVMTIIFREKKKNQNCAESKGKPLPLSFTKPNQV